MALEQQLCEIVEHAVKRVCGELVTRLERAERLLAERQPGRLLYGEAEAAHALGLSPLTLKKWRVRGLVKAHTPIGAKRPLYSWPDIERIANWLAERAS